MNNLFSHWLRLKEEGSCYLGGRVPHVLRRDWLHFAKDRADPAEVRIIKGVRK
jgi:hypothetical protein